MIVAQRGNGTNEKLMNRTVERMNREQVREMVASYQEQTIDDEHPYGRDFYADVGVFGHRDKWFTELSGDEALKFEVKLLGIPQNDQQEAEVAALEAQHQMEETGFVGRWLAGGSVAEQDLHQSYAALQKAAGGSVTFGPDGTPKWTEGHLFDGNGKYNGDKPRELSRAIQLTRLAAEAYAEKIDSYANAATMGIAIIGAIVAAVVTVATWGAATPLLVGAITFLTGLAAMGAHKAISGGRYGWEEMLVDLGMTTVQAITAGVGQSLSIASRGGMAAIQAGIRSGIPAKAGALTGKAFTDMLLIGAATGGLNALGATALQENTWSKGLEYAIEELLAGLARGVLSGTATAAVSNAFDDVKIPKLPRSTVQSILGESTNPLLRGGVKAVTNGLGAFAGRGVELGFEKGRRRYKGDAGDMFVSALEAAAQNAGQSFGEGAAEATFQAGRMRAQQRQAERAELEGAPSRRIAGEAEVDPLRVAAPAPPGEIEIPVPRAAGAPELEIPTATRPTTAAAEEGAPRAAPPPPDVAPAPPGPEGPGGLRRAAGRSTSTIRSAS